MRMTCPHCKQPLSPEQITKLWAQLSASKRKVKSGGKNGGRPKKQPDQSLWQNMLALRETYTLTTGNCATKKP